MPYEQRLHTLCAQTLEHSRLIADESLIHRCIHSQVDFHPEDIGVMSSKNNERNGKLRLEQHSHANRITNGLFVHRAVREWNQLPAGETELRTLT